MAFSDVPTKSDQPRERHAASRVRHATNVAPTLGPSFLEMLFLETQMPEMLLFQSRKYTFRTYTENWPDFRPPPTHFSQFILPLIRG